MMKLRRGQLPVLAVMLISLIGFGTYYLLQKNFEFITFIAAIIFFLILIVLSDKKVQYPNSVLWGLTFWALIHMGGGCFSFRGVRFYDLILIPITEDIFRYDQAVHIVGFGAATLAMYAVLRPLLKENINGWFALSVIVIMAGLGVGAFNEIVEFGIQLKFPEAEIGGYRNTSLDLVSDLIGSIIAMLMIRFAGKPLGFQTPLDQD